jgi:hypothetical protein
MARRETTKQSKRRSGFLKRQSAVPVSLDCHGHEGPRNDEAGAVMDGGLTAAWYQDLRTPGRRIHFLQPGNPVFMGFPGYSGRL